MMILSGWLLGVVLQALLPPSAEDVRQMSAQFPRRAPMAVASGIADAVRNDPLSPLMGSYRNEALLMLTYAWRESTFRTNAVGDHGESLGLFQLQRVPKDIAFDPRQAAVIWLRRAHEAYVLCSGNNESERLAALCSGNCGHGRREARHRFERTMSLLVEDRLAEE